MFFAFPFVEHEYIADLPNIGYKGIFRPGEQEDFYSLMMTRRPVSPFVRKEDLPEGFDMLFRHFADYFMNGKRDPVVVKNLLGAIIGEVVGTMQFDETTDAAHHVGIEKLIRYCLANFSDPELTLTSAAASLGYSRTYLSQIVADSFGCSFPEYLVTLRVRGAQKLLLTTDKSITEIAYECGFSSQRNFNRVFLLNSGLTPKDYRTKWYGKNIYEVDELTALGHGENR